MIDEKIIDIFIDAVKSSHADQTEYACESEEFYLTRFAENLIHQNMGRSDSSIWCRAVVGKKVGVARSNNPTKDGVADLTKIALDIANNSSDDPDFSSLVKSDKALQSGGFYRKTFDCPAASRADSVAAIIERARSADLTCAGTYQTSGTSLCVVNSLGTEQFGKVSDYRFSLTAAASNGRSGWSQAAGRDIEKFDFLSAAQRALDKASYPGDAIKLESGQYNVILEPDAVANFLLLLAFLGFGGKTLSQKRSFMSDKIGQAIMGSNITISEDPFNPVMRFMPFDYEGVPKKKVMIVEKGIAGEGVYDSYFAKLAGKNSTGNALEPDNNYGPYPKAMVMSGGSSTVDEMIKSTPSGIYITRFWYLNFLNPMKTMVTGYTRDGTFLIEDGKITKPIVDMRIQQSMLEAFSNAELLSSEQRLIPQYGTLMMVPFMKIANFSLNAT
jgi:predicted Zn-dependent protease